MVLQDRALADGTGASSLSQLAKLTAGAGSEGDEFGSSIALDDTVVVAGAPGSHESPGFAYVVMMPDGGWGESSNETIGLTSGDGAAGDGFGTSVSIDGSTVVVGAPGAGSAYVFTQNGGGWGREAKLTGDGSGFGTSVSVSGSTVVVGAPGAGSAYVFTRTGASWSEQAKLTASDGGPDHEFGYSVAIDGDTVVVGAPGDDDDRGATYIYVKAAAGWEDMTQTGKLTARGIAVGDRLGFSVALDGETVVAGAPGKDEDFIVDQGSAYVFLKFQPTWSDIKHVARLTADDGSPDLMGLGGAFGHSVAVSGDTVVVGAPKDHVGFNLRRGSAYAFSRMESGWGDMTQTAKLTATDRWPFDRFGTSVASSGGFHLIGSPGNENGKGAGYVFAAPGTSGTSDAGPSGLPDENIDQDTTVMGGIIVSGGLTDVEVTLEATTAGQTGSVAVSFTSGSPLPAGGQVAVTFPRGFDLSGAGLVADGDGQASFAGETISIYEQTITVIRSDDGEEIDGGTSIGFVLSNIKNPKVSGPSGGYAIMTANAAGEIIDPNTAVNSDDIGAGSLAGASVRLQSLTTGEPGSAWVSFTTTNPLPSDGQVVVTFPAGVNVGDDTRVTGSNMGEGVDVALRDFEARRVTVRLSLDSQVDAGTEFELALDKITYLQFLVGLEDLVLIETKISTGYTIDQVEVKGQSIGLRALTDPGLTPVNTTAGEVGEVVVSFVTASPVPADGSVVVTFPESFELESGTSVVSSNMGGGADVVLRDLEARKVTVKLSLSDALDKDSNVSLTLDKIKNPRVSGVPEGTGIIETQTSSGAPIDRSGEVRAGVITPGKLDQVAVVSRDPTAGAVETIDVRFTLANELPSKGLIWVTIPGSFIFNLGAGTDLEDLEVKFDGIAEVGATARIVGQTVIVSRFVGHNVDMPEGTVVELALTHIKNPGVSGVPDGIVVLETQTVAGIPIDRDDNVRAKKIAPGVLTGANVEARSKSAGAVGAVDVIFTTANPVPADGEIRVTFPPSTDLNGRFQISDVTLPDGKDSYSFDGGVTLDVVGSTVYILRRGDGTALDAGSEVTLRLSNITNPSKRGLADGYDILTADGSQTIIDQVKGIGGDNFGSGAILDAQVRLQDSRAGATGYVEVSFIITNDLPTGGSILVTFPEGFVLNSGGDTGVGVIKEDSRILSIPTKTSVFGQNAVVKLKDRGRRTYSGASITLELTNIKNPSVSGPIGLFGIGTVGLAEVREMRRNNPF